MVRARNYGLVVGGVAILIFLVALSGVELVSCEVPSSQLSSLVGGLEDCVADNDDKTAHDCDNAGPIPCHTTLKWYKFPATTPNPDKLLDDDYVYCSNPSCEDKEGEHTNNDPCDEPTPNPGGEF